MMIDLHEIFTKY